MPDALLIVLIALGTFALRASFIAILGENGVPKRLRRGLRFVPAAVLPALFINQIVRTDGQINLASPQFPAALVALVIAARTRSILWTIVTGLVAQAVFMKVL
jgi:branched-subunit amino acid transport protein